MITVYLRHDLVAQPLSLQAVDAKLSQRGNMVKQQFSPHVIPVQ